MKFSEWLIIYEGGLADKNVKDLGNPMKKLQSGYTDKYNPNKLIPSNISKFGFERDRGIATKIDPTY
jgi:hypothetical protein